MTRTGYAGIVMAVLGITTIFILIPAQISEPSSVILKNGVSPTAFPKVASWGVVIFGIATVLEEFLKNRREKLRTNQDDINGNETAEKNNEDLIGLIFFLAAVIAYVIALPILGHLISTPLAIAGFLLLLGERSWVRISIASVLTTVLISVLFRILLNTILPTGILL